MDQHSEQSYPLSLYPGSSENASESRLNHPGDENVLFLVSHISFTSHSKGLCSRPSLKELENPIRTILTQRLTGRA